MVKEQQQGAAHQGGTDQCCWLLLVVGLYICLVCMHSI